ncbi:hypothetical protein RhiirA1_402360 [Rhizophagus irregularis]|uniref:Transmembrane protein n=1 Tax=Rhizophagus irregularis TaxID=588596 RepID=A0A2N0QYK5_9GLOM|nr:hypothetical protein RhiirA1_402360 [Rhizophagus irregularis]
MILVLLHFSSLVQRSQFFSILALQFKDLGSLVFQLFGLKVPVFSILALRFKGPGFFFKNFGTLVPVLSLATLALWHFSFTYRKQLQITLRGLRILNEVINLTTQKKSKRFQLVRNHLSGVPPRTFKLGKGE